MDHQLLYAALTSVAVLTDEELALLLSIAEYRILKKRDVLLSAGEPCRCFYFVEQGYLRTWYDKDGVDINLDFTFEGGFTTNYKSIKRKQPSEFYIEAGEKAAVWIFKVSPAPEWIRRHDNIVNLVRRLALNMLLASETHNNMCKTHTPVERYHYIETHHPGLLQRVPLSQLASYLGVTRETLSRIRANTY